MKRKTRLWSGLLVCLMCAAMLAACKGNGGESDTTPGSDGATTPPGPDIGPTWETDENGYIKDNIPDDTNYGGKVINLLCWSEGLNNVIPKEAGKNEVQEEVYLRRLNLEGRLNINFNVSTAAGSAQNKDVFLAQARLANESKYDLICSFSLHPSVLAQEGLLYNLNNLQYPQLDMAVVAGIHHRVGAIRQPVFCSEQLLGQHHQQHGGHVLQLGAVCQPGFGGSH